VNYSFSSKPNLAENEEKMRHQQVVECENGTENGSRRLIIATFSTKLITNAMLLLCNPKFQLFSLIKLASMAIIGEFNGNLIADKYQRLVKIIPFRSMTFLCCGFCYGDLNVWN
jgi:hypothetical protein